MRTNGFALFMGRDPQAAAERAARRVQRYSRELIVRQADDLGLTAGPARLMAFYLDGKEGMPVVHGFPEDGVEGDAPATGEFARLGRGGGGLFVERDPLGTRGLFVDTAVSCIASDHRFFSGVRPRLLKAGIRYSLDGGVLNERAPPAKPRADRLEDLDDCVEATARMLKESVERMVAGKRKVAVSFSGGLDSSLIALVVARSGVEVVLCSAFAGNSRDEKHAASAADRLGMECVSIPLDEEKVKQEVGELDLPFEASPMDRALWCIYSSTSRAASENGAELLMLGQLADELFGGYQKYSKALREHGEPAAEAMMVRDVFASGERAFIRDEEAVARFSEARFPFADEALVELALRIPVRFKIRQEGERKSVLRRAALALGLPEELASAPKKAAQYSSGVAKLVA